jgi:hypothetical protein
MARADSSPALQLLIMQKLLLSSACREQFPHDQQWRRPGSIDVRITPVGAAPGPIEVCPTPVGAAPGPIEVRFTRSWAG